MPTVNISLDLKKSLVRTLSHATFAILLLFTIVPTVPAQIESSKTNEESPITASASGERVRFTSPASTVQIRLEVYSSDARRVFDNEVRGGNVLDWLIQDGRGQRLTDGSFLCVVTIKALSGRINQRFGSVIIQNADVSVHEGAISAITPQQAAVVGPLEENASLNVLRDDKNLTTTVVTHNGNDGQLTRGKGALSFRIGDLYNGKDAEQMRLTTEGNLGIGTSNPQARLDVNGVIKASEGIIFPDGSIQFSAALKTLGAGSLRAGQSQHSQGESILVPEISGTGTTGRISKWLDGPNGVLGDSNITEVTGAIGINATPNTNFRLDVNGSTRIRGSNPGFNLEGLRPAGNIWLFQTVDDDGRFRLFSQDNINPGIERLTISLSTGNVGIGTSNPATTLDVAGSINASTQYNLGGSRVFSVAGLNNTFTGVNAGAVNTGTGNSFYGRSAGLVNTNGSNNSFFGYLAGAANISGNSNAFFGRSAGTNNTAGSDNSFFGESAGGSNTTGASNSFFGESAGVSNTVGNNNSFFGRVAGAANNTGSDNAFFGTSAGTSNTAGMNNAFFGRSAGLVNTTGSDNSFFGRSAGAANTASNNAFFGSSAGSANTTGNNNSFMGAFAGVTNSTGVNSSFFGRSAGFHNTTGNNNSFFGAFAGSANTTGFENAFFGFDAGSANTTGGGNSFFGSAAGATNLAGDSNSFFGRAAGTSNNTGNENAFFGFHAGFANTLGSFNAFFGSGAGDSNASASGNAFFGAGAGSANFTGALNTFVGFDSGAANNASFNTFIGSAAGTANTTGSVNTFTGRAAGAANTTGSDNTFTGGGTGAANTTGFDNTFFGRSAGLGNTTGHDNTFIGNVAGNANITGSSNTTLGSGADFDASDLSFATAIGAGARVGDSNRIVIGRPGGEDIVEVPGLLRILTFSAGNTAICTNLAEVLAFCSSSRRYKESIQPFRGGLDLLQRFRPVIFDWKQTGERDVGLIAEEVAEVEPLLITRNKSGEIEGVKYNQLNVVLINAIKEQQELMRAQQQLIAKQEERLNRQERALGKQQLLISSQLQQVARQRRDIRTLRSRLGSQKYVTSWASKKSSL